METDVLFTKQVPICSQSFLGEKLEPTAALPNVSTTCGEFVPSFSNHGLCLTRNADTQDKIFRTSSHLSTFNETFIPSGYVQEVQNISEDPLQHHFTFMVDGNSYKDLRRGQDWNESSYNEFNIGVHLPTDIADIRGWNNKIINVATGYLTNIKIDLSKQDTDHNVRDLSVAERKCKFSDENDGLSTFKFYSKINCIFDCKLKVAEEVCGCRPWDYPIAHQTNDKLNIKESRICDFFGSSCFNDILRRTIEDECKIHCVPECNKIDLKLDINEKPLEKNRICLHKDKPFTNLELHIKKYIESQFSHENGLIASTKLIDINPEQRTMNLIKDILIKRNENESYYNNAKEASEKDCLGKLRSDIAVVIVSIDSPTYTKATKSMKVTWFDQLAVMGKIQFSFRINVEECNSRNVKNFTK